MARSRYPTLSSRLSLSNIQGPSGVGFREASRTMGVLSQQLDRMSNVFFKQAVTQAEIEGAEYGANNAITEKQLKDAIATGEDLETQLGDTNTVFGRAMRKSQLSVLETELELSAKKQISEVMVNALSNEDDPDEVAKDLDAVTIEYTKLANSASPIVGKRLGASLNAVTSSKYHEYAVKKANEQIALTRAKNLAIINEQLNDIPTILTKTVNESESEDKIGLIFKKNGAVDFLKAQYFNQVSKYSRSKTSFESFFKKFDEQVNEFKTSYILNTTLQKGNHSKLSKAIRTNNYKNIDYRLKGVITSMSNEERLKLFKSINTQSKEIFDAEENEDKINEEKSENKLTDLKIEFNSLLSGADRNLQKAKTILNQIRPYDNKLYETLSEKYETEKDNSDPDIVLSFDKKLSAGTLTYDDLINHSDGLDSKDKAKYFEGVQKLQDKQLQRALTNLTGLFNTEFEGFDPGMVEGLAKNNAYLKPLSQYKKIKAELVNELADAKASNRSVDLVALAKSKYEEYQNKIVVTIDKNNLIRGQKAIDKIKATVGKAYPQLANITNTQYADMLEFLVANKKALQSSLTERTYELLKKNIKTAIQIESRN